MEHRPNSLEVVFRLTADDYAQAHGKWHWYFIPALGAGLVLFAFLDYAANQSMHRIAPSVVLSVMFLGSPWLLKAWVERDFAKHPYLGGDWKCAFSEDGFLMEGRAGSSQLTWNAVVRWKERPNLMLLYLGARMFYIIPKRAFDEQQLVRFRDLVSRKTAKMPASTS